MGKSVQPPESRVVRRKMASRPLPQNSCLTRRCPLRQTHRKWWQKWKPNSRVASRQMLIRVITFMLLLSAGIAAEPMSHSFVCKASGRLGRPVRFEFFGDSTAQPKTDIKSFTVSMRTDDDRWKAMWSILSGHGLTQPIQYGVTPAGFTTMIQPQKLMAGRVYAGFATDKEGGSSRVTFGFDKNGKMTFPDSFDQ
jgi:hypothetical protein